MIEEQTCAEVMEVYEEQTEQKAIRLITTDMIDKISLEVTDIYKEEVENEAMIQVATYIIGQESDIQIAMMVEEMIQEEKDAVENARKEAKALKIAQA